MGWELRSWGRSYYCRTLRVDGDKRIRQYLGSGAVAESAAATDALRRAERDAQVALHRDERARMQDVDRLLMHFFFQMSVLATGALVAAGCYLQCGSWRS
jgi:hypothetical protein